MQVRRLRRAAGIAAMAITLFLPGRSWGWGQTWFGNNLEQAVKAARWKLGLVKYNLAFRIDNAGYDSDIYYGTTGRKIPDYTFSLGPDARIYLPLAKQIVLDINEIPQYIFYLRTTKDRAFNNYFRGKLHFALDRVYLQIGGDLINAKERLSTELEVNVRRRENDLNGLFFVQLSPKTAIALKSRTDIYRYETPSESELNFQQTLNRRETYVTFTGYLQQTTQMRYFVDAEYGNFVFSEATSHFKDSHSFGVYGGIEFIPPPSEEDAGKSFLGKLNFGYKRFDVIDPRFSDFEGLVGNTSLSFNGIQFTTLRGMFTRDIQFSAYSALLSYLQTVYSVGISRFLSRTVAISYDIAFVRNDYQQFESAASTQLRLDKYITHTLELGFKLGRDVEFNLQASFSTMSNNIVSQINHRTFIGFNLTFGSPSGGIVMPTSPFARQWERF
jgi:hypothetical protein